MRAVITALFVALSTLAFSQTNVDTLRVSGSSFSRTYHGDSIWYSIDSVNVSKAEFDKLYQERQKLDKCKPCYVIYANYQGQVTSEGLMYANCAPKKTKETNYYGREQIIEKKNCKEGPWIIYNLETGTSDTIQYQMGKEISEGNEE